MAPKQCKHVPFFPCLIIFSVIYLSQLCHSELSTEVQTEYGPIRGTAAGSVAQFLSIPYAKPPLRDLRWTRPQPPEPWTEPLNCTQQPDPCAAQNGKGQSEDCLYLNVFSPSSCTATNRCGVLLWIHGGGYMTGDNHNNGTHLASLNVVRSINSILSIHIQYSLTPLSLSQFFHFGTDRSNDPISSRCTRIFMESRTRFTR